MMHNAAALLALVLGWLGLGVGTEVMPCKVRCGPRDVAGKAMFDPVTQLVQPRDNSCRFHAFPFPDAAECLKGTWLVFFGGSTTQIIALRTAGFLKSRGLDTSFLQPNQSATLRGLRNIDVIFTDGADGGTVEYADMVSTNNMTPEKQTAQVNAFLRNANANYLSRRAPDSSVDVRVTLLQDRYGLAAEGLARSLQRFTREVGGLTRVFFIIGPIGVWFDTCTPKALKSWSCNVEKLRGKSLPKILDAYRKMWVSTLFALARARKAGTLSGTIVVPHRRLFQNQYDMAVEEVSSRLLPSPGGSAKELLPLTRRQNFEDWYQSPLAWSLYPQPYNEEFEGHPSGVVAHWTLIFILTAICRHDPGGCPINPVFSKQCHADYIYGAPDRPKKPWNGNDGGWASSLLVKGCRVTGVPAVIPSPGYRLGSASGLAVPFSSTTAAIPAASAAARPPREAAEEGATSGEPRATMSSQLPRLWLLALGCAGVVAAILWREQKRPSAEARDKAAGTAGRQEIGLDEGPRQGGQAATQSMRIESLVFSRYIASLHVVAGHLYARGFRMSTLSVLQPALSWGFSWVPFFFMLSGFVLAYAKAGRISPYLEQTEQQRLLAKTLESPLQFAYKRSINVVPLYLLGLVGSAGLSWLLRAPLPAASNPAAVLSQALLLQAWFPFPSAWLHGMPSIEHTLQAHCWFISCEVAYWFLFPELLRRLVAFSLSGLLCLAMLLPAAMLMLLLWLLPALLGLPTDWEQHTNGSATAYIALLKFFPLCYWHLFVVGMAGACVFRYYWHDRSNHSGAGASSATTSSPALIATLLPRPLLKRACYPLIDYGALIGYLAVLAVLFSPVPTLQSGRTMLRLCFRLGLLAPLHGLILLGLAAGTDPIARAFTLQPLQTLGNWSYAQFIFQFIAFRLFFDVLLPGADPLHWLAKAGFFLFLTAIAALAYTLVQAPLRTERRYNIFLCAAGAAVLMWVALLIAQSFEFAAPQLSRSTPAYVSLELGCFDVRLNFTLDKDPSSSAGHGAVIINPSALRMGPGKLLLVARRHRLEEVRTAAGIDYVYHSALVVTTMNDAWQQSAPWKELRPRLPVVLGRADRAHDSSPTPRPAPRPSPAASRTWMPCHKQGSFFAANNTHVTVRTTGPQDPRLFLHDGRFAMLGFFSMKPVLSSKAHADLCAGDVHGQVYLAQVRFAVDSAAATRHVPGMAHKHDAHSLPTLAANLSAAPTAVQGLILGPVYYLPLDTLPDRLYAVTDQLNARLGTHPTSVFKAAYQSRAPGSKGLVEKNWLFFEYAGRTLMVYRIYPHVVVGLPKQQAGMKADTFKIFRGDASLLGDIVRDYGAVDDGLIAHGGAAPVPFRTRQGKRLFLASFHTLPLYRHYLYIFEPSHFDIVAVSAPLPLTEHPSAPGRTFMSSLLPSGDGGYAVLYGCADKESRVLVLTNTSMAALFAHADL